MERKKCLDDLSNIASTQEYYQTLTAEIDNQTLSVCASYYDTDALQHDDSANDDSSADSPIAKLHNGCIYDVRGMWDWLQDAQYCMGVHLKNSANYHKFHHEWSHMFKALKTLVTKLRDQKLNSNQDTDQHNQDIRELTGDLLDLQVRVDGLVKQSSDVVPLPYRKIPAKTKLKGVALVNYTLEKGCIEKDEELIVTDNSDPIVWKVKRSSDMSTEVSVPSLIVLIPSPNGAITQRAQQLQHQMLYTYKLCVKIVQLKLQEFYHKYFEEHTVDQIKGLDKVQRETVSKDLDELVSLLSTKDSAEDSTTYLQLTEQTKQWQTAVSNMKPPTTADRNRTTTKAQRHWKATSKVVKNIKELMAYVGDYQKNLASSCETQHFLVQSEGSPIKFVSNAYIERVDGESMLQTRSITIAKDGTVTTDRLHEMTPPRSKSSLAGDNGHVMMAEKSPLKLVRNNTITETVDERWVMQRELTYEEEEYSQQTSREIQTFVIVGVTDPSTGDTISIYQAIHRGIINQVKGTYVDTTTKNTIPIPEAMDKGLIQVEYTNRHIENDAIKRGVITTKTAKEMISYIVKSVIDPQSGEEMSVEEAVQRGIIDPNTGAYVCDPTTGETMSLQDAVEQGKIHIQKMEKTKKRTNRNGEGYADDSVDQNQMNGNVSDSEHIIAEDGQQLRSKNNRKLGGGPDSGLGGSNDSVDTTGENRQGADYVVSGVYNPKTKQMVSLEEAVKQGLIDASSGMYVDPVSGKAYTLEQAKRAGLVDAVLDPSSRAAKFGANVNGASTGSNVLRVPDGKQDVLQKEASINAQVYDKLKTNMDTNLPGIIEELSGVEYTIGEAHDSGILSFDPLHIENSQRESYSLPDATIAGLVKPDTARELLQAIEPHGLDKLIDDKVINPHTGRLEATDPTGHAGTRSAALRQKPSARTNLQPRSAGSNVQQGQSLSDAIANDVIDPDMVFYRDIPTQAITSLSTAIANKQLNPHTGRVFDPDTNEELTLEEAMQRGLIDPSVDPSQVMDQISAMGFIKSALDPKLKGVTDPRTNEEISIEDAIHRGILDIPGVKYNQIGEGQRSHPQQGEGQSAPSPAMTLSEAVDAGYVKSDTAKAIYAAMSNSSLDELIASGALDPNSGKFIDPVTGRPMTIKEAIAKGLLDPTTVFLVDPETKQVTSLAKLIENGKFNPVTGKFKDPLTGLETSIAKAIKNGVIEPGFTEAQFVEDRANVQALLEGAAAAAPKPALNGQTGTAPKSTGGDHVFVSPDGRMMSVREALDAGYITPQTNMKVDPQTGVVRLCDESYGEIVQALIDTDDKLDYVRDLEKDLSAQQDKFAPDVDELQKTINEEQVLQKEIEKRRPSVEKCLQDTQQILLKNKQADGPNESGGRAGGRLSAGGSGSTAKNKKAGDVNGLDVGGDVESMANAGHNGERGPNSRHSAGDGNGHRLAGDGNSRRSVDGADLSAGSATGAGNSVQCQKLRGKAADLKLRFHGTTNEIDARLHKLEAMQVDVEDFNDSVSDLNMLLDHTDNKVKDIRAAVASESQVDMLIDHLQTLQDTALSHEDQVNAIHKTADKYKAKAVAYAQDSEQYKNSLPSNKSPTQHSSSPAGVAGAAGTDSNITEADIETLDDQAAFIADKLKAVVTDCDLLMDKLSDTAAKNGKYQELRSRLQGSIPAMKSRMDECQSTVAPGSDGQGEMQALSNLTADVVAESKVVEDFANLGNDLLAILDELDCSDTPKAKAIRTTINDTQKAFDTVQEGVTDKQHKLTEAVVKNQDVGHNINTLLEWINDKEAALDMAPLISIDIDALNNQISDHRVFMSDIDAHKARISSLAEQCGGSNDSINESIEQLTDRFDILESRASQRSLQMNDTLDRLTAVHQHIGQLQGWLGNTTRSLKRGSHDYDNNQSLKNKVENLFKQKSTKQEELDHIRASTRALLEDEETCDKNKLREALTDVQTKWNELAEILMQMVFFSALKEVDESLKYLDKAENTINTAESISTDPETLAVQLREHKAFDAELEAKRQSVNATIDKCNKLLRHSASDESDEYKSKLNTIRNQAELVAKLSRERLTQLEETLPLASHFSETHTDLQSWLGEIEAEVNALELPDQSTSEQIKKQQENAKTTKRIIDDHKPLVEDLHASGYELAEICGEEDSNTVRSLVDAITQKYDTVRTKIRDKVNTLDDALRHATSDAGDAIDGLLEELHYVDDQTEHADPIAVSPEAIKDQITENNTLLEDVECRAPAIQTAKDSVKALIDQMETLDDNQQDLDDLCNKLEELDALHGKISRNLVGRSEALNNTLAVSQDFSQCYSDALRSLRDIQDNLLSQDSPGVDTQTITEQQKELNFIKDDLETIRPGVAESNKHGSKLAELCGTPGNVEIQKYAEDLEQTLEDVSESVIEREDELNQALQKAERFDQTLQTIMSWLPQAETRLSSMAPISTDPREVRIQIEELKVLAIQVKPRGLIDVQNLQQSLTDLKHSSPITAESLTPQVENVTSRWNTLINGLQDRETQLKDTLMTLGELDHAIDDTLGFLQATEEAMNDMDDVYGDPKCVETHLKKMHMIQRDVAAQKLTIDRLNKKISDVAKPGDKTSARRESPLLDKQQEMNDLFSSIQLSAQDRMNQLQDTLKEVRAFIGEVEDNIRWFTEFRNRMKTSQPMGALPDTAQKQYDKFMNEFKELDRKAEEAQALLLNGEDMVTRCREGDGKQLTENLAKLHDRVSDTAQKADRKKRKLNEHLSNVKDFHAMLKLHTEWLGNAEKILASFKHPSKLVEPVRRQIKEHSIFREDVEAHREVMLNLDRTGTYLKYFGRKQDTVYIKNLLLSIKLRWKKLVRRVEEKGRLLEQAHREDKRFYDAWKGLCDWLDEGEKTLKKYGGAGAAPAKVKQDIDELKAFQHELSFKHPVYYSTMRLGRSLSDRCTKTDPERESLQQMLDELKNKWTIIRSMISQRQNKLDEALLSSGRFTDALQSLLEWLTKAEAYLSEDQPILGDLDTVHILVEQHKAFTQELDSRSGVVNAMKTSMSMSLNSDPDRDPDVLAAVHELSSAWDRVNQLTLLRENRLQQSLELAEDFSDQVQVVREWLPQAEAELKYRALPEDEASIIALIEKHDQFEDDLRSQQPKIERIKYLADQILGSCHPNAVRFVKYYLTITQTRWEQALNRSAQRAQRLHDALRQLRGNAALLEELLAWLTEAQALLTTKERDPIPEDLTVVEALVREHLEFHEDLAIKNQDVDKLTKVPIGRDGKSRLGAQFGSNWKLSDIEASSSRVTTLQNKWRNVWRMSVDRKKKLQDILDHLLELESFKNFDFELWRQRYISWVRAKKLRITDFFRRQDKQGEGYLTKKQFVEGMITSKFPTNRTELNAVFEIFDRNRSGEIDYKEFIDALRPERSNRTRASKRQTDAELIHDEIEQQVAHCQCRRAFRVDKIAEGKYKMGDKQKLCLVRFLNNTVMVRVGGGWVTLAAFLDQNDPCKARGRTNMELREAFLDGGGLYRASFTNSPARRSSTPLHNSTMKANGKVSNTDNSSNGSMDQLDSSSGGHLASSRRGSNSNLLSPNDPSTPIRGTRRTAAAKTTPNGNVSGRNSPRPPPSSHNTRAQSPSMRRNSSAANRNLKHTPSNGDRGHGDVRNASPASSRNRTSTPTSTRPPPAPRRPSGAAKHAAT